MRVNPAYIQLIGDAIIPLLGYFLWDWSLYFIVLFYLLDYVCNEIIIHLKVHKTNRSNATETMSRSKGMFSFLLLVSVLFIVHVAVKRIQPTIDFPNEIVHFVTYKDLGIEQGYFLIPLVFFTGYQRYKMDFIATGKFTKTSSKNLWNAHIKIHLLILSLCSLVIGSASFFVLPDACYIFGIVIINGIVFSATKD